MARVSQCKMYLPPPKNIHMFITHHSPIHIALDKQLTGLILLKQTQ